MENRLILVIDAGTTSTRALIFTQAGQCLAMAQEEIDQNYPQPGWVEHDAAQIWDRTLACIRTVVGQVEDSSLLSAVGITNQRETVIFWDRRTGEPLAPAIVWQDRRTADICARMKAAGHEAMVTEKTGLLLDPYFSASKIAWALENWPDLRAAGDALAVGTVESYLIFRLTGGLHISDASNASRTSLMDIEQGRWDNELLALFDVKPSILPQVVDNIGHFATCNPALFGLALPICGLAGDQQAATIGQGCLEPGQCKATYGTGAFILSVTGTQRRHSAHRLLSTIGWQQDGVRHYALEGSIFVAGSLIKWLRDTLGLIASAAESEALAREVEDNGGVYLVPAHSGLGAPHWNPHARGQISGLGLGSAKAHIVRAALEAMAYQTHDLQAAFAADGATWSELRIDGGMSVNDWMAQDLADILQVPVIRPDFVETTAKGAAILAAVGCGMYPSLREAAAGMIGECRTFAPAIGTSERTNRLAGWQAALAGVLMGRE